MSAHEIVRAGWRRDLSALLQARFSEDDLGLLARTLGSMRDAGALERLAILLHVPSAEVRVEAAGALGRTPGGAAVLRDRLTVEQAQPVRDALLRALGTAGGKADVEGLVLAMTLRADRSAASEGLGRLANRGVDISPAMPSLVSAVEQVDLRIHRAAAFALYRARPSSLSSDLVTRLQRRRGRLGDDATRAWVTAVLMGVLEPTERRALLQQALREPYALTRVAALNRSEDRDLDSAQVKLLAQHPDGWVRAMVAPPDPGPLADVRRRVAAGDAEARVLLGEAMEGSELPRARTAAATTLLAQDPTPLEIDAMQRSTDPVVRELLLDHLAKEPGGHTARIEAMVTETAPATRLAWLRAARASLTEGWRPSAATVTTVRAWRDRSGLDKAVRGWLAEVGLVLEPVPSLPGPPVPVETLLLGVKGASVQTTKGAFRVQLDADAAPLAVANFVHLAETGSFEGHGFHRVVPGFVVQTGDSRGDGMGGPDWFLPDELSDRAFDAGSLGMARSEPDTAGSQWFVTVSPQPHLRGEYTWFGQVTSGLDVVRRLDVSDRIEHIVIDRVETP